MLIVVFIVVYISGWGTKWFIDNFSSHCCPAASIHNCLVAVFVVIVAVVAVVTSNAVLFRCQ